ncbi:heparan-alpha-glucosaminide N-acetyltransferase domain-containing protein [Pengzhenrongella sicca]|uniref:DUF1624 domain-containing protein n=1 Tax=Pengzhenrongella sicca TaxID=2819238 RepID=A0A8A4Z9U4_9MICO|nr:heparan-alpha-glucosaminide N-acetyltransferase domain-containing protein [Pengzhenrongella sicca]QTE28672.1 DUF1624 domain-containing protein [Pengzhenrongella sicca]
MKRIVGIDVARGLAVLGMITAHVGVIGTEFFSPTGWLAVVDGRSAATFAVLAGVSIALLSGGPQPATGVRLTRARIRLWVRALVLLALGFVLTGLGTPVAVILPSYAAYFVLALPFLRTRSAVLLGWAAAVAVLGPPVCFALEDALAGYTGPLTLAVELVISGYYPAGIWMAYVLTGLAVGRLDLGRRDVRERLLLAGPCLAVLGYVGGGLALRAGLAGGADPTVLRLLTTVPHSDTTFEVVGNIGVALAVLGGCLVLAERAPRLVYPLAATGALSLSAYSFQIVAIAALGDVVVRQPHVGTHLAFLAVTLLAASAWHAWLGRGPLERVLHGLSTRAADSIAGAAPAPGPTAPPAVP